MMLLVAQQPHVAVSVFSLRLPLQRFGSLYSKALQKHPLITHVAQGATISGVSRRVQVKNVLDPKCEPVESVEAKRHRALVGW